MGLRRAGRRLLSAWAPRADGWAALYARWGVVPVGGAVVPWAAPRVPFHHGRIALVTAAGVHPRSAPPFDMENPRGDASFREIRGDVAASQLMITHDYYDHAAADLDVNTVFPLEPLGEPGAVVQQRRVLWDALGAFALIAQPGGVIELSYRWKRSTYVDPLEPGSGVS